MNSCQYLPPILSVHSCLIHLSRIPFKDILPSFILLRNFLNESQLSNKSPNCLQHNKILKFRYSPHHACSCHQPLQRPYPLHTVSCLPLCVLVHGFCLSWNPLLSSITVRAHKSPPLAPRSTVTSHSPKLNNKQQS